jgi:hypothetical protein
MEFPVNKKITVIGWSAIIGLMLLFSCCATKKHKCDAYGSVSQSKASKNA